MLSLHPEFSKGTKLKRGQSMMIKSHGLKGLNSYDGIKSNESSFKFT